MKNYFGSFFVIILSGCFFTQDVTSSRRPNYPFDAYWVKTGMTQENRQNDSRECGAGNPVGKPTDYSMFTKQQIDEKRLPTEGKKEIMGPMERLKTRWIACMSSKGYENLETCNNERCMYTLPNND